MSDEMSLIFAAAFITLGIVCLGASAGNAFCDFRRMLDWVIGWAVAGCLLLAIGIGFVPEGAL